VLLSDKKISALKKQYETKGYIVARNIFDRSDIIKAGHDLESSFLKSLNKLNGRNVNKTKNNIINSVHFMNNWKWSKRLKENKILKKISKVLLDDDIKDFGSELFAKPAKVGLASPMHQDNYYWCIDNAKGLTIWIALDDSNEKNGGVFYYEKSHHLGLLEHRQSFAPGSSQTLKYDKSMKYFKKKIPNIKKGDCIIHDCLVVHGSSKNTSLYSRRGLTIRYIGNSSNIDSIRKKKYETDLKTNVSK
tara:strand:+ start:843 stop:1583 length:741 start_codon:yes stop_codon:yes gene_type:complete